MMDTDTKPGDICIGGYITDNPSSNESHKKCNGNGKNDVKIKAGFVMNDPPAN